MMKTMKKIALASMPQGLISTNRDLVSVSLVIVYAQVVTAVPDTYMISILCSSVELFKSNFSTQSGGK